MLIHPTRRIALACAAILALHPGCQAAPRAPQPSALLERVVVVGASMSSGAGLRHDLGAHVSLVPVVESVLAEHARGPQAKAILDLGTYFMFKSPVGVGTTQVEVALEHRASLVIAVDFLFWFVHGDLPEEQRIERLEIGLALLDRIEVPLLVGDLPDITYALSGRHPVFGGPIIPEFKIPSHATRARCNQRIRQWAEARPRVSLAPFESFAAQAIAGHSITLPRSGATTGGPDILIQADHLHPTLRGTIALLLIAMDVLVEERESLRARDINWDPEQIRKLVLDRSQAQRQAAKARRERIHRIAESH